MNQSLDEFLKDAEQEHKTKKQYSTHKGKNQTGLKRDNSCFCVMTNNLSNVSSISIHVFLYGIPCIN